MLCARMCSLLQPLQGSKLPEVLCAAGLGGVPEFDQLLRVAEVSTGKQRDQVLEELDGALHR